MVENYAECKHIEIHVGDKYRMNENTLEVMAHDINHGIISVQINKFAEWKEMPVAQLQSVIHKNGLSKL